MRQDQGPDEDFEEFETPPLSAWLERSPGRIAFEAMLGGAGGAALAATLPQAEGHPAIYILVGAVSAPAALLLTPVAGAIALRAVRYGLGLAVVATLLISFIAGSDGLTLEEVLALLLFVFCIGAVGHGVIAATLDRDPNQGSPVDRWPPGP